MTLWTLVNLSGRDKLNLDRMNYAMISLIPKEDEAKSSENLEKLVLLIVVSIFC